MTFEEKVRFLRSLPEFKVVPISEVRAIAFAAQEKTEPEKEGFVLGQTNSTVLVLSLHDIERILRVYPDLKPKLKSVRP